MTSPDSTSLPSEDSRAFGAVPDAFQRLWTPHRQVYISGEERPQTKKSEDCPFCAAPARSDEDALIVYRGEKVFALMNLFP